MASTGYDIIGRARAGGVVYIEHLEGTFAHAMAVAMLVQRHNADVETAAVYYDWLGAANLLFESRLPWRP